MTNGWSACVFVFDSVTNSKGFFWPHQSGDSHWPPLLCFNKNLGLDLCVCSELHVKTESLPLMLLLDQKRMKVDDSKTDLVLVSKLFTKKSPTLTSVCIRITMANWLLCNHMPNTYLYSYSWLLYCLFLLLWCFFKGLQQRNFSICHE